MPDNERVFVTSIAISGYRGFSSEQKLSLAIPDDHTPGSGLTVLVGPNSGGKSSVIELAANLGALRGREMRLKESMRNKASERVKMTVQTSAGRAVLQNSPDIQFKMLWTEGVDIIRPLEQHVYLVPPRRQFTVFFGESRMARSDFVSEVTAFRTDRQDYPKPNARLMALADDPDEKRAFDLLLRRLLGFEVNWRPDLGENNQFYLRVDRPGGSHDSDGMGFGIVSLIYVLDAVRDLPPGEIVIIDEPELSLHPAVQRRLAAHLREISKTHQVLIATHSPYFANVAWIQNGTRFARVAPGRNGSRIFTLKQDTAAKLAGMSRDLNNPHVLGLEAGEFLFLDEAVVLTEGQEDALLLPKIAEQVGKTLHQPLYGWGVGGADKMPIVCQMLKDFGLKKVIGVLDRNKGAVAKELRRDFATYRFFVIPTDDIRDKPARRPVGAKAGLVDRAGKLHKKYRENAEDLIEEINGAYGT